MTFSSIRSVKLKMTLGVAGQFIYLLIKCNQIRKEQGTRIKGMEMTLVRHGVLWKRLTTEMPQKTES